MKRSIIVARNSGVRSSCSGFESAMVCKKIGRLAVRIASAEEVSKGTWYLETGHTLFP